MPEVVIWVRGGLVQAVYCNEPGVSAEVVDIDEIEALDMEREKAPEPFVDYLWSRRALLTGLAQPVIETNLDDLAVNTTAYPHMLY